MGTQAGLNDVYHRYSFHVVIDGITVAGFHKVSNLGWDIQEKVYSEGNSPTAVRRLRMFTKVKDITLETGSTLDSSFFQWGLSCADYHYGGRVKRDVTVIYLDRNGNFCKERTLENCWVKDWAGGDFDAMASEALIEKLILAPERIR